MMADTEMVLSYSEFMQLLRVKHIIKSKFDVTVSAPDTHVLPSDLTYIGLNGSEEKLIEAVKFLNTFVFTGLEKCFVFPAKFQPIFANNDFIHFFEAIFDVNINYVIKEMSLVIIGESSKTDSTISMLNKLLSGFLNRLNELSLPKDELTFVDTLKSFFQELLPNYYENSDLNSTNTIQSFLCCLQKVNANENSEDKSDSDDDIVILELPPTPETEVCVITISDDESEPDIRKKTKNQNKFLQKKFKRKKWNSNKKKYQPPAITTLQNSQPPPVSIPTWSSGPFTWNFENTFASHRNILMGNHPNMSTLKVSPQNMIGSQQHLIQSQQTIIRHQQGSVRTQQNIVTIPQPNETFVRKLRPIVIDGSNIAREHGNSTNTFSWTGIKICIEYFLKRGHTDIATFVPRHKEHPSYKDVLKNLSKYIVFTPSRRIDGLRVSCYDDRFIVELAVKKSGVIVSNDHYRDIMHENPEWKKAIEERLLMYCFAGDIIMFPKDPLGRHGPTLDELLTLPTP